MSSISLSGADRCIYCGYTEGDLTKEHVIPHSLNGRIIKPFACCARCQPIVNHSIEEPIVSRHYSILRAKGRFLSRTRFGRVSFPLTFVYFGGRTEEVYVSAEDMSLTFPLFTFSPPPFLSLVQRQGSLIEDSSLMRYEEDLVRRLRRKYRPEAISVQVKSEANRAQFVLLLKKIACGLFFDACPDSTIASGIGMDVVILNSGIYFTNGKPAVDGVYSTKRRKWSSEETETFCAVREVCEAGRRWLYCEINVMSEFLGQTYYVRIPSIRSGHLLTIEYNKKRRQSFFAFFCQ